MKSFKLTATKKKREEENCKVKYSVEPTILRVQENRKFPLCSFLRLVQRNDFMVLHL